MIRGVRSGGKAVRTVWRGKGKDERGEQDGEYWSRGGGEGSGEVENGEGKDMG